MKFQVVNLQNETDFIFGLALNFALLYNAIPTKRYKTKQNGSLQSLLGVWHTCTYQSYTDGWISSPLLVLAASRDVDKSSIFLAL